MKVSILFFACLLAYLALQCGSNNIEEGEIAFQNGNYTQAIKFLHEAYKQNPNNNTVNEKLVLAYMYRGQNLFIRTKNIKSFAGNYEKAVKFVPQNVSPQFKTNYGKLLLALAQGYLNSKGQNDLQKREFLDNAIARLEEVRQLDAMNSDAESLLNKIANDNFQNLFNKGKNHYEQAIKSGNANYLFSAEYYLNKALSSDPDNKEIINLLQKLKEKTLSVLNYKDNVSLAVADFKHQDGKFMLDLRIKNYLVEPISLRVNNFKLVDNRGKRYNIDEDLTLILVGDKRLVDVKLDEQNPYTDGILVFPVPDNVEIEYIAYNYAENKISKKYFP